MISVNPEPCWILVHQDGKPVGAEDGTFHYQSRDEAARHLDEFDAPYPEPRQETTVCVVADCDDCGWTHDEDNFATHWESIDVVRQAIKEADTGETTDTGDFTCVTCLDEKAGTAKVEAAS